MKIRSSKLKTALRCSFCHDEGGDLIKCPTCGTQTHGECKVENGGCPTMGCRDVVRGGPVQAPAVFPNLAGWQTTNPVPQWYIVPTTTLQNEPRRDGLYDTETFIPQGGEFSENEHQTREQF